MFEIWNVIDIQIAFTDNFDQINSKIIVSNFFFQMSYAEIHEQSKIFVRSICKIFSKCSMIFFHNQIIEAIFMLQRLFENISLFDTADERFIATANKLNSLKTCDKMIINTMKFEKIFTIFFFVLYFQFQFDLDFVYRFFYYYFQRRCCWSMKKNYDSVFFACFNSDLWKKKTNFNFFFNWISITVMRQIFVDLINWPLHLRYIFDTKNKKATLIVIFISYNTFATKTIVIINFFLKKTKFRVFFNHDEAIELKLYCLIKITNWNIIKQKSETMLNV